MANLETLQKIHDFCSKAADLVRESEGSTADIQLTDLRTRLASADIAKFTIDDGVVKGLALINGANDPSIPTDDVDYLRKTFANFADKVRNDGETFSIDQLLDKEDSVCGIHKDAQGEYGIRIPDGVTSIDSHAFYSR